MVRTTACVVLTLLLGLAGALWPRSAEACACCDGSTTRTVKGWSKTGRTLLVETEDWSACEQTIQLELYRVNHGRPAGCYDLFGDPDRKIACDKVEAPEDFEAKPRRSAIERRFTPAEPIAQRYVRSWRRPAPPPATPSSDGDDDAFDGHLEAETMVVELWTGTAWQEVWRGQVSENRYPGEADEPELSAPLKVEVWPAPGGERAALLVRNDYTDPSFGHFYDHVIWIDVPEDTRALPGLLAPSPSWQGESIPELLPPTKDEKSYRRDSARENSRGLRLHRAGKFGEAAPHFIEAVRLNPRSVMARYNLACALAREGLPERALTLLEELNGAAATGGCPACALRIDRAEADEDFKALRADPRFQALVGSGT